MAQEGNFIANTFQLLGQRLNYINHDLKTTSTNVENLRTPGYKEQELAPFSQFLGTNSLALKKTHPGHLSSSKFAGGGQTRNSPEREMDFTGNNVNLRTQLMRANQSGLNHTQMTNLYRASAEIVEMALLNTKG